MTKQLDVNFAKDFKEIMDKYTEYRKKYIDCFGVDTGFNDWFANQLELNTKGVLNKHTPYDIHSQLKHHTTWYSPDGYVKIEECATCGMRFLHNPSIGYPITLSALKLAGEED